MPIDEILSRKFKRIEIIPSAGWRAWEYKSLNRHRAILEWTPSGALRKYADITIAVRAEVMQNFKVAWWRGMGFGVVIYLDSLPEDIAACMDDIDGRENPRGTWQWSIIVFNSSRVVMGMHTWLRGFLSEAYDEILKRFESEGYQISGFKKDKDKLMQFLTLFHPVSEYTNIKKNN